MNQWFAAHIIMFVEYKKERQSSYPVWENVVLIHAAGEDEAFQKAEAIGRAKEGDEDGTFCWGGRDAKWVFGGVRKLTLCENPEDRPGDRTEISYIQMRVRSREHLNKLLNSDVVGVEIQDDFGADDQSQLLDTENSESVQKANHAARARRK